MFPQVFHHRWVMVRQVKSTLCGHESEPGTQAPPRGRGRTLTTDAGARGRQCCRSRKLGPEKLRQLRTLTAADKTSSVRSICDTLGISKATFYRYLNS